MARDHARLDLHIWSDEDYRNLSLAAKTIYLQLVSQPKLSYSGVLDLAVKRWARAHPDLTVEGVRAALSELDAERFVVIDQDTEELLVRSFIRNDQLFRQPNVLRAALRSAFEIESPILRTALAAELRRLPVAITGPAPAVAATELEAGARELPAVVKAAMGVRGTGRPAPAFPAVGDDDPSGTVDRAAPAPSANPSANPSGNPSANPSPRPRGEGSRERETGVSPLTSEDGQVGVPAPTPPRVGAPARTREAAEAPPADHAQTTPVLEYDSARQTRRAEAERLVTTHSPEQPRRVLDRLRGEVTGLLGDGVEPAVIAAGLRTWAGKKLAVSFLPELVGEHMRAAVVRRDPDARRREIAAAETFEAIRACAVADDDRSPTGLAVRGELPAHAEASELQAILDQALADTLAGTGFDSVAGSLAVTR